LFTESEEFGFHKGLGILSGRVRRFPSDLSEGEPPSPGGPSAKLKIPHIGWNAVEIRQSAPVLRNVTSGSRFYFVHSYYVEPGEPSIVATETRYGLPFVSSVWRDNIFACQFHPEKSQALGLQIIKNFAEWKC
jgi:glutamine amidotransferase